MLPFFEDLLLKITFNSKVRRKVYMRLAMQLRFNVPLLLALQTLKQQSEKRRSILAKMYTKIVNDFQIGSKFSYCLVGFIPYDELMLIRAGEESSSLEEGLELASKVIVAKNNITSSVRTAIAYPAVLFCMVIVLLLIIAFMVIPNLALVSDPNTWTGSAYTLYVISYLIASPIGILLGVFFALSIFMLIRSLSRLTGRIRVKLDKFPPYSFYRLTIGATWLYTMASLIKSGKQLNDILKEMIVSDTNSAYLKERLRAILKKIDFGIKFGDALSEINMGFPDESLVDDIKVYSELTDFETTLYRLSEEWLQEGVEKIKESSKVFNMACLFLITFIVLNIVFAFQSIQQILTQGV